jgi:hypothetical protein
MASAPSSVGLSDNWLAIGCPGDNFGQYENDNIGSAQVQQQQPGSQKTSGTMAWRASPICCWRCRCLNCAYSPAQ